MAEINDISDIAWQKLAVAIVAQACVDYGKVCKVLNKDPKDKDAREAIDGLKQFFKGQWLQMLCDYEGESLMKMIEKRFPNQRKRSNAMRYFCEL